MHKHKVLPIVRDVDADGDIQERATGLTDWAKPLFVGRFFRACWC
jgi:hypothetical protein